MPPNTSSGQLPFRPTDSETLNPQSILHKLATRPSENQAWRIPNTVCFAGHSLFTSQELFSSLVPVLPSGVILIQVAKL